MEGKLKKLQFENLLTLLNVNCNVNDIVNGNVDSQIIDFH